MDVLLGPREPGVRLIDDLRTYVFAWGIWAPLVYIVVVIVEVLVAPIPGTLLYAPAGAIWGGFIGGTLSLVGNVTGATIACWLAGTFGERWAARASESSRLMALRDRLRSRGAWLIFILRVNPLTSGDYVSYAAGLAGVPPRTVAIGTFAGMIPHCYAQAYLAEALIDRLPAGPWTFVLLAIVAVAVAIVVLRR
jgi:uncharacterized membrane protein YdjX (TVP38/TMEM64 family)